MWGFLKFHDFIFHEEWKQRRWVRVFSRLARLFQVWVGGAAVLYAIWAVALRTFFSRSLISAWIISVLIALVAFLILLLRFAQTYQQRLVTDLEREWSRRVEIIHNLGWYLTEGKGLFEECKHSANWSEESLKSRVVEWNRGVNSALLQIDESYRDRFYKNSNTGTDVPPDVRHILGWMNDRLVPLAGILKEFKGAPSELRESQNSELSFFA